MMAANDDRGTQRGDVSNKPFTDVHVSRSSWLSVIGKLFRIAVTIPLVLYCVAVALLYSIPFIKEKAIYMNMVWIPHDLTQPEVFGLSNARNYYLEGRAGKLGTWHISPGDQYSELDDGNPVVVYLHGNSFSRSASHRVELYKILSSMGFHVVAVDYRGFGDSDGSPSQDGLILDGLTVYHWVKKKARTDKVFVWGHSLGTSIATGVSRILSEQGMPPKALMLESPFNNASDAAMNHPLSRPFRFLPYFKEFVIDPISDFLTTDKWLVTVKCPVLILHAHDDHLLPIDLARKLHSSVVAVRSRKLPPVKLIEFQENLGHKFIYTLDRLPDIIRDFFQ